jgi:hypothetical protein
MATPRSPCRWYNNRFGNSCRFGDRCHFQHTRAQPIAVPPVKKAPPVPPTKPAADSKICRHWARGFCQLGNACNFIHSDESRGTVTTSYRTAPCRMFLSEGSCRFGSDCRFIHSATNSRRKAKRVMAKNRALNGLKSLELEQARLRLARQQQQLRDERMTSELLRAELEKKSLQYRADMETQMQLLQLTSIQTQRQLAQQPLFPGFSSLGLDMTRSKLMQHFPNEAKMKQFNEQLTPAAMTPASAVAFSTFYDVPKLADTPPPAYLDSFGTPLSPAAPMQTPQRTWDDENHALGSVLECL